MSSLRKKYVVKQVGLPFNELAVKYHTDPLIIRLMGNRNVPPEKMGDFLLPDWDMIENPYKLRDIKEGAEMLLSFIHSGKKIRVIGDYDIDGIMSTYILTSVIRHLKGNVSYAIPNRVRDGYGLNERLIEEALEDHIDLVITCDNGIAARDAISLAREKGIHVIVTDHHAIPYEESDGERRELLPEADFIVNPHREGDKSCFKEICGGVVAWKFCQVLSDLAGSDRTYVNGLIENAAFATVGDVMPLKEENRAIVKLGIDKLKKTENIGMSCLIKAADLDPDNITSYTIGFVLGPMFNASGRLEDAKLGVELLLSEDRARAEELSLRLKELNAERKNMTEKGTKKALEEAEKFESDKVLVIYLPKETGVTESVVGIVAGRVRESTGKPAFVLTDGENCVKGSGRSIPAYSMYDEMHKAEDLFLKYGGHTQAAGLSIEKENVDELRRRLNEETSLTDDDLIEKIELDADMPLSYLSEDLINDLSLIEPFGQGNPRPLFGSRARLLSIKTMGREGQFLRFNFSLESGKTMNGVMFRNTDEAREKIIDAISREAFDDLMTGRRKRGVMISFTYYPAVNEYRGVRSLQAIVKDIVSVSYNG